MTDIWGEPVMLEDKADAVMFVIGLLRRLDGSPEERYHYQHAAETLESLLEVQ